MDRWPAGAAQGIGDAIMLGLELLAAISILCVVGAGTAFVLARRMTGTPATALRWVSLLLALAALGPPMFVVWAVGP